MGPGKNGSHVSGNGRPALAPGRSGRGFVIVLTFLLVGVSLAMTVLFRQWRGQYQELSAYGAQRVATAIDPLIKKVPGAVTPEEWAQIVGQVHELLVELTAAGALDVKQMRALRNEIQERINGVRPETSAEALAGLWSSLEDQAGPILAGRSRTGLSSAVHPLGNLQPTEVPAESWALALVQTRAMLAALGQPTPLPKVERELLRSRIEARLKDTTPERARTDLHAIWQLVREDRSLPDGFPESLLDAQAARVAAPAVP